jgi:hypothetical protein
MLLHSAIIGIVLYVVMLIAGQQHAVAENRSIVLAACVVIYMILFGHGLPLKLNRSI